jgi:AAA ATPase-like protein
MTADPGRESRATALMDRRSERATLTELLDAVRASESRSLIVRGDPGIGKTVLLEDLAWRASRLGCRVARAVGVQSEMELAFASLHQLCAPMLSQAGHLPTPQRDALRTALGLAAGPPPDRFLVGLAVLSLLAGVAEERPLICVIDDVQWVDQVSAQALGFAARRLAADPVGLLFAARDPGAELAGLPELEVHGLRDDDARALLESALAAPLDERVADLIVAETRGNPLALLELPRGLSPAELAGGFGLPGAVPLTGWVEDSFRRHLDTLPDQTRRLLLLAAADPSGNRPLVWRAAERLSIAVQAGIPAEDAGLVEFGVQVRFRHPLVRSVVYRSASCSDRQQMHAALAEVTDPQADPDRRAWHRAQAASGPDEDIAVELERSAGRAQARGGLAAAAAFLERSVLLTSDPARYAERTLAAAAASMQAGAFGKARELLAMAGAGPLDDFQRARVELLRAHVAFASELGSDAPLLLLKAASRLEPFALDLARETYLTAWGAAGMAGHLAGRDVLLEICRAVQALPRPGDPRPLDLLVDGLARLSVFVPGKAVAQDGTSGVHHVQGHPLTERGRIVQGSRDQLLSLLLMTLHRRQPRRGDGRQRVLPASHLGNPLAFRDQGRRGSQIATVDIEDSAAGERERKQAECSSMAHSIQMSLAQDVPVQVVPQVDGRDSGDPGAPERLIKGEALTAECLYGAVQQGRRCRVSVGVQDGHPLEQQVGHSPRRGPGCCPGGLRHQPHPGAGAGCQAPREQRGGQRVQIDPPGQVRVQRLEPAGRRQEQWQRLVAVP